MILHGDVLKEMSTIEDNSIDCIVTSPPYNKKGLLGKSKPTNQIWGKFEIDYDTYGDDMPESQYQLWMIDVLNEMYRVIKPTGSIFFNHKPRRHNGRAHLPTDFISKSNAKLYQLIIWNRRNSPNIRNDVLVPCTEHIYWLCKDKPKVFRGKIWPNYRGEVWEIIADKQKEHPAPFPKQLAENCILLSTEEGDKVLDPFLGSGTTYVVAKELDRKCIGIEMSKKYYELSKRRIDDTERKGHLLGL